MNAYSQGTEAWKQATKNITISAYSPVVAQATVTADHQITAKRTKIDIPSKKDFTCDFTKATQRRMGLR